MRISERDLGLKTFLLSVVSDVSIASHWANVSNEAALSMCAFISLLAMGVFWHHMGF